jgi:hypothetical protein
MTAEQKEIEALKAELAAMKARSAARLTLKVSALGAVSLYGLGQWPVTLYSGQWEKVLGLADDIKAFIAEHREELATGKEDKRFDAIRAARAAEGK